VVNVDNLLAAAVVQEHNNSLGNQDLGSTWRNRGLLDELGADAGWCELPSSYVHSCFSLSVLTSHPVNVFVIYTALKAVSDIYSNEQLIKTDRVSDTKFLNSFLSPL